MPSSRADVLTPQAHRYARELVTCLARRLPASLDGGTTTVVTPHGHARLTPLDGVLVLQADADDDTGLASLEDLVGGQLSALAGRRELAVEWVRDAGGVRRTGRGADRPAALLRLVLAAARLLFRVGLGRLLGHRLLLLRHVGRRSGRRLSTVLQVVAYDPITREAVVMAGFGRQSDWYLDLRHRGPVQVEIAGEVYQPVARELDVDEASAVMAHYERRTRVAAPFVRVVLSGLVGWRYYGTPEQRRQLVTQLPLVGLRPKAPAVTAAARQLDSA